MKEISRFPTPPVSGSGSTELFTDTGSHLVFVTLFGYQQAFTGLTDIARPFKSRRTSQRKKESASLRFLDIDTGTVRLGVYTPEQVNQSR